MTTRTRAFTFLAVLSLACAAPLASLHFEGLLAAFRYFAADAFYYLAIADRSADAAFYTFDGSHPTNGFHPLWQWLLSFGFAAFDLSSAGQIRFVFAASIAGMALGTALFALAVLRVTGSVWLTLLTCVPGFFGWLVPWINPHVGSAWSFANGMESPLSILCFGVLVWLLFERRLLEGEPGRRAVLLLSSLLTLLTLSRLDDIFVFVPFLLWLAATAGSPRARRDVLIAACAIPTLVIGAYLLHNLSYAGAALPLSGAAKSFGLVGGLLRNGYAVLTTFLPFADIRDAGARVWGDEAWRVLQMLLPALAALLWLAIRRPPAWSRPAAGVGYERTLLALLAGYVLLKVGYNFVFVGIWQQGHWYYPLCIMIFNLLCAAFLAERLPERARAQPAAAVACFVFLLVVAGSFTGMKASGEHHRANFELWQGRESLARRVAERCRDCGLLSFDDGIVAWSLGLPTLNGMGLSADAEAYHARREGRLLELAQRRGHRLLTTLNYPIAPDLDASNLESRLAGYQPLRDENLERWRFELVYRDDATGVVFIAFEPRR